MTRLILEKAISRALFRINPLYNIQLHYILGYSSFFNVWRDNKMLEDSWVPAAKIRWCWQLFR
jgi:hypothetical protein